MQDIGNMPIAAQPVRRRTWPWAAGSILAVALILAATLIGRHIAASHRAAGYLVSAPAQPTLSIHGATPAGRALRLAALDPKSGDLLALTSAPSRDCPPSLACASSPVPDTLAVYDGATGRQLASRALVPNDPLTHAAALLVDGRRGVAYAVVPPGEGTSAMLYRLSPATAEPLGEQTLSSTDFPTILGSALVPTTGDLALIAGNDLLLLDPSNGAILSRQPITSGAGSIGGGVAVDARGGTIYLVESAANTTTLRSFSGTNVLQSLSSRALPTGTSLGDYDSVHNQLVFIGPHGDLTTLAAADATNAAVSPQPVSGPTGARAIAWDGANGRLVVAHTNDVTVYDTRTGKVIAALPVSIATTDAAAPASRGLFAGENGRVYLRDATGMFVIAGDTAAARGASDPGTALLLARSAMARFLPTPKQTPPFVAASSFPVGAGARSRDYFIDFSDRGWQAYPSGSIASAVSAMTKNNAAYQVTFTISWYQLFQHTHTWTCLVMPDGSVRLSAEAGDALP